MAVAMGQLTRAASEGHLHTILKLVEDERHTSGSFFLPSCMMTSSGGTSLVELSITLATSTLRAKSCKSTKQFSK
eukprot:6333588-Amphidinium_carterae.1